MSLIRTAAFIDGPNIFSTGKLLDFDIDYKKLLVWLQSSGQFVRANYYTTLVYNQDTGVCPIMPMLDWLAYNGYIIRSKEAKEYINAVGQRRTKGDMGIEMAVDMLALADRLDHIYLFSGDGDYLPLVAEVQRRGVHVTVVSSVKTSPPMCADELRRQADEFLDLADLRGVFAKPRNE